MTRAVRLIAVLLLFSTAVACGGNPNSPSKVSYAGTWNGTYNVTACNSTGDFATVDPCSSFTSAAPFSMTLAQQDITVTGTFTLGSIGFQATGSNVASDGSLTLVGTSNFQGLFITATWTLTEPSSTTLAGSLTQLWTSPGVNGQVTIAATLNATTKQ